ncbi:MAG: STAS domain-containing protein [Burkholderiaceae bacterium]|nr:MAG: STAS domain-containing protein [Burkholderiaceae bacterium]
MNFSFRPRLFDALTDYSRARFFNDVSAGVTVGVVALPLAMAFAIASGVAPQAGIYTAIIAGFLIATLGGSRVQIGGPAGAFIVVLYGILQKYGLANLLISGMLAGVLLFSMGLFRIGNLIRFIPVAVVTGFTNGIAILIAFSQVRDFLGLDIDKMPADFFSMLAALYDHLGSADWQTLSVASVSLLIVIFWPKTYLQNAQRWKHYASRVPGTIVALVLATVFVALTDFHVATIGSHFGGIPQGLPAFELPTFTWSLSKQLVAPTITIALLCAIESLLCARVADNMIDERHDPNQELMAQGVANFVTPFFGGIPATGTIARTVTNIRSGATSPIAGMVHSATLLLILLIAAPLAAYVPLATLAAILMFIAYNMGEWRAFPRLRQFTPQYRIVLVSTFLLTVIFDLTVAVEVGMVLASLFFIYRISDLTRLEKMHLPADTPAGIEGYRIFGSLFFGAVSKLEVLLDPKRPMPKVMIFQMHQLISLDTTGLETLEVVCKNLRKHGAAMVLCDLNKQPRSIIRRSGFLDALGPENLTDSLEHALARARQLLATT